LILKWIFIMSDEQERWKPLTEPFEAYSVSDLGRVHHGARILKVCDDGRGHLGVCLHTDGRQQTQKVHRLVAAAFIGDGAGQIVKHFDKDGQNCRADNLYYAQRTASNCAKLTAEAVNEIREAMRTAPDRRGRLPKGTRQPSTASVLAKRYAVKIGCVYAIAAGKTWRTSK
jgi:hypothetical protein